MATDRHDSADTAEELQGALDESETRYRALVTRSRYGVFSCGPDGRVIDANLALARMLGYSIPPEVHGLDLAQDIYLDANDEGLGDPTGTGEEFGPWVNMRWKRRDRTPITVRIAIRARVDKQRRPIGREGVVEDVTEQVRHEEILRRSERMATLGTTLAGVAHELNNPLAAIIGFTQLLLRRARSDDDRTALETINHEATRSARIVKDLLTLARRREFERRSSVDVNDVIAYVVRTRRYGLETNGITCDLQLDPESPQVLGDRTQLEQVLLNLLSNAEQAFGARGDQSWRTAEEAPRITVRSLQEDDLVVLEIEDNGPGIPEGISHRIWDPFWTTKEEGQGTGLGLAVVHGIVVDHGGTISVDGAPGHGARFSVRLPRARGILSPAPESPMRRAVKPLDVLVVDTEREDLDYLLRFLRLRGHAVLSAPDLEGAVRLAHQVDFDAVVCGPRFLGAGGSDVSRVLRALPGCARARFAILTGAGTDAIDDVSAVLPRATVLRGLHDVEELRRAIEGE